MSSSSPSSSSSLSTSTTSSSSSPSSSVETVRERNNRIVKDLSDRVIKGWTLLASTCPTCQTALVRSREGQVYCVGCRMPVVTEAEARQRNLTTSSSSPTATQPSLPSPPSALASPTASASSPPPPSSSQSHASSPPHPSSHASSFPSSSSPFSLNRPNALSNSSPPRDSSSSSSSNSNLISLSSSPHYAELTAQLNDVSRTNGPIPAPSSTSSSSNSSTSSSTVPAEDGPASSAIRMQSQIARTNDLSAKLGAKMMQGWTLMGVHCADESCLCPLMKNPRSGELLCVACGSTYTEDGQPAPSHHPTAASSSRLPSASSAAPSVVNGRDEEDGSDEISEEDLTVTLSDEGGFTSRASTGQRDQAPSTSSSSSSSPSVSPPTVGVSDVSALLSEKLLQGWTMLAQECPNPSCSCPLMRKKQGPMHCVQCGSTVVTQEEKDQMDRDAKGKEEGEKKEREREEKQKQQEEKKEKRMEAKPKSKRTAFEGHDDEEEEGNKKKKDDFSDRLSSLNSSSLVHSLSHSPLVRHHRPSAISSSHKFTTPALIDASPATRTPPSTPASFPFPSPLPSSQHLSASISSAFSAHPVYPPPGYISRHNSSSDFASFPQHNVGLGSLSFQPSTSLSSQRTNQHTPAGQEKGKFSFRSASAVSSLSSGGSRGVESGSGGYLSAPTSGALASGGGVVESENVTPVTSMSPVNSAGVNVVQSSVDVLYGKLDVCRGLLLGCMNIEQMTQIAQAMKEIGQAIKVLHSI